MRYINYCLKESFNKYSVVVSLEKDYYVLRIARDFNGALYDVNNVTAPIFRVYKAATNCTDSIYGVQMYPYLKGKDAKLDSIELRKSCMKGIEKYINTSIDGRINYDPFWRDYAIDLLCKWRKVRQDENI